MTKGKNTTDRNEGAASNSGRRQFLKGAANAGAGALIFGGCNIPKALADQSGVDCKVSGCDFDVIVIGGGFAGVTASRDSVKNGYKTLLLEARNRLGGRTFTADFDGHKVELGGTWIHQSQPFVWAEKERYGMEVLETPGGAAEYAVTINEAGKQKILSMEEFIDLIGAAEKYISKCKEAIPRPYDLLFNSEAALAADSLSAVDRINQLEGVSVTSKRMLNGLFGAVAGGRAHSISYFEALRVAVSSGATFLNMMDASSRFKLKEGTKGLIENMIADATPDIRISTPVKSVEDLGDKVRVISARGESFTAGAVIVTLPMNVLPNIDFTPALDQRVIAAAKEGHAGTGYKQYIKVKGQLGKFFSATLSSSPYSTIFTYEEGSDFTLLAAFGGSDNFDPNDDHAVQEAISQIFPGTEVISSFSYDWQLDPYSQGMYCLYRPGWMKKYAPYFQKDAGRILFSSGDHGAGWRGYIDGAVGAGVKSAQRAKRLLG